MRRAVRGFALLCAVLVCTALAGSVPGWASGAVVASLVTGGLLVATVRYRDLTYLVGPAERLPAWSWLLAVLGAVLVVIVIGALLSQVLRVDALLWGMSALAGVLRYALAGVAYLIAYAGAGFLRAIAWLLGVFHLHALRSVRHLQPAPRPTALVHRHAAGPKVWNVPKLMVEAAAALVAIGLSSALVAVALRRIRRALPAEVMVVEERETLASVRSAAGMFAARLGRRLRRRLSALRRQDPRTPGELVRHRYAELERRLSRAGKVRLPGVTVRDYLAAAAPTVAVHDERVPGVVAPLDRATAEVPLQPAAAQMPLSQAAADLAAIYELARYSARAIDAAEAHRFEALARAFLE